MRPLPISHRYFMDTNDVLLAFCTCPDTDTAERIAQALVNEQLAACVNQLPGVRSVYRWQGTVQADQEVLLLIKTTQNRLATVAKRLEALHPYQVPELVALPVSDGNQRYLEWVRQNVAPSPPPASSADDIKHG